MNRQIKALYRGMAVVLVVQATVCSALDWPQWRGPDRTDISKEKGLLKSWPAGGPKRLWLYENAGHGYAGFSVAKGVLYTMGTRDNQEAVFAIEAASGKEKWVTKLGDVLQNDWGGGPRSTPTVDGDRIYALSGPGVLACLDLEGKVLWKTTMKELGGSVPDWGFTESVLVDGDKVVCTPGGSKGAIAAFDKKSGKLLWQTKEFTDPAQYSSILATDLNGSRQYIQMTMKSVVGVDAKDGKLLWKSEWPGRTAVIPTPIYRDGHVYVTAGYGVGCRLMKIGPKNDVTTVYENNVMKNHHGGVVLVGDHVYGHSDGYGWVCQNFKTGEEVWHNRDALGKGAAGCSTEGMLYCLDERSGTVALIEASPKGWSEQGRFKLDPQTKIRASRGAIWVHPVVSDGRLFLRDQDLIYCYDVKAK